MKSFEEEYKKKEKVDKIEHEYSFKFCKYSTEIDPETVRSLEEE